MSRNRTMTLEKVIFKGPLGNSDVNPDLKTPDLAIICHS